MTWATEFFAGRHVVITGGTSGIGQGIGRAFADAGAIVHATGATQAEVESGADNEPRFRYTRLDVRSTEQVGEYADTFAIDWLADPLAQGRRHAVGIAEYLGDGGNRNSCVLRHLANCYPSAGLGRLGWHGLPGR